MTELTTKEKKLQKLKPAVAPIAQEAPRVTSGSKKEAASFATLLKLAERTTRPFKISYGKRSARLLWPGLSISSLELVQLLKTLPRANRIHIAVRDGENTTSLAYDGKLYKSKLAPPDEDGLLLYWKQAPPALAELEDSEPEKATPFVPEGDELAAFSLKIDGVESTARLYRGRTLQEPGLFFVSSGLLLKKHDWSAYDSAAPHCQVVVEVSPDWVRKLPSKLARQCKKLARLAESRSQDFESFLVAEEPVKSEKRNEVREEPAPEEPAPEKPALEKAKDVKEKTSGEPGQDQQAVVTEPPSSEPAQATPKKNVHIDLAKRLADSPRFQAAYQALKGDKPSLPKVLQLLEILCHGGGQMALQNVVEELGLLEHQVTTLVSHLDTILHKPGEYLLSLSIDRKVLLLDLERLSRSFALELSEDDIKVVRAETIEGEKRSVRLPIEVKVKERRALEALLRYGRLSEQELSQITSSRRIGGILERLLSTLEGEGFHGLAVVGEGAEGRIFSLQPL